MSFQVSTRGRYGLRAMLELALHCEEGPVPLRKVAEMQDISFKYLEQLTADLKDAGLVQSVQGAGGGYKLARPPSEIKLIEIMRALEGELAPVECVGSPEVCSKTRTCATREVWSEVESALKEIFGSRTLRDLVERQKKG